MFKDGSRLGKQWTDRIQFKVDNNLYHHLKSVAAQELKDNTFIGGLNNATKSSIRGSPEPKSSLSPGKKGLQNLSSPLNQRDLAEIREETEAQRQRDLEEEIIAEKIRNKERFTYHEMTLYNIQKQFQQVPRKWLLHKNTVPEKNPLRYRREDEARFLGGLKRQTPPKLLDQGDHERTLVTDESLEDLHIEGVHAPKQWHPELQRMIMDNIDYKCQSFKNLVSISLQRSHLIKSEKMRTKDDEKAKRERDRKNQELLNQFYAGITIRSNLLDYDFIAQRYKDLSPIEKAKAKREDYEKYDFPATLEKKEIQGFLKIKLERRIEKALDSVLKHQGKSMDEVINAMSPQKVYYADDFVEAVIRKLKTQNRRSKWQSSPKKTLNQSPQQIIERMEENASNLSPSPDQDIPEKDDMAEYERIRVETLNINSQLSGKIPEAVIVMKTEAQKQEFINKMKAKVSNNSLLEAHSQRVPEDEDIIEARRAQKEGLSADQLQAAMAARVAANPHDEELQADVELLYVQMCQDQRSLPFFQLFSQITDRDTDFSLVLDKPLNTGWCKIIKEILSQEKDFQHMVKRLILKENFIRDADFAIVLDGILNQEGLEYIGYFENELGEDSLQMLDEFLFQKNLDGLTIKNPRGMNQDLTRMLIQMQTRGRALTKLDLIGIKHLNTKENFSILCDSIVSLTELKYLSLSDNGFNPKQVGELSRVISEANTLQLKSLDLSHNIMSPKRERLFKNKKDKVGYWGDSEETLLFYNSIALILSQNIIQHLNLEWMRLGNRILLLCDPLVSNTSVTSMHLSNNLVDEHTLAQFKWWLSIGIDNGIKPPSYDALAEPSKDIKAQNTEVVNDNSQILEEGVEDDQKLLEPAIKIINPYAKQPRLRISDWNEEEMAKIQTNNITEPEEFKKNYPPRQQYLAQPVSAVGTNPRKILGMDEIYEGYHKDATMGQSTAAQSSIKLRNVHKNLEMNLVNQSDKQGFAKKQAAHLLNLPPQTIMQKQLSDFGGTIVLSRLIGHLELEPLNKPLFTQEQMDKARFELAEAERQKKEIEQYGGILKDGIVQAMGERPDSSQSQGSNMQSSNNREGALSPEVTDGMSSALQIGRSSTILGSKLSTDVISALKNIRYDQKSTNMDWRLREDCWYCHQFKHSMMFYQRSKAQLWFKELKDSRYTNMVPKELLEGYRNNIRALNSALERLEEDDPASSKLQDANTILDPVVVAKFEICEFRQLKNPHEYLDKLIRDEIFEKCKKGLEHKKHEIFKQIKKKSKAQREYLRHFMVEYENKMKAETKGIEWLKTIKKRMKYENDTLFLNCPPFQNLNKSQLTQVEESCRNSDLFMASGFLKPGPQMIIILDNRLNFETGKVEEVLYGKEFLIPYASGRLAPVRPADLQLLEGQLAQSTIPKYQAIQQQNERESLEALAEQKKLAKEEAKARAKAAKLAEAAAKNGKGKKEEPAKAKGKKKK